MILCHETMADHGIRLCTYGHSWILGSAACYSTHETVDRSYSMHRMYCIVLLGPLGPVQYNPHVAIEWHEIGPLLEVSRI